MQLKPQDMVVLLKLLAVGKKSWAYNRLALELGMSSSEVHAAIKRVLAASLAVQAENTVAPNCRNLEEFLVHGIRYVFVPEWGALTRGMPTGYAAPPLDQVFVSGGEPVPVWPDIDGVVRGTAFSPLYKSVPAAAKADPVLYEWLVLVDAIRGGRARERAYAISEIQKRLAVYESSTKSES